MRRREYTLIAEGIADAWFKTRKRTENIGDKAYLDEAYQELIVVLSKIFKSDHESFDYDRFADTISTRFIKRGSSREGTTKK